MHLFSVKFSPAPRLNRAHSRRFPSVHRCAHKALSSCHARATRADLAHFRAAIHGVVVGLKFQRIPIVTARAQASDTRLHKCGEALAGRWHQVALNRRLGWNRRACAKARPRPRAPPVIETRRPCKLNALDVLTELPTEWLTELFTGLLAV